LLTSTIYFQSAAVPGRQLVNSPTTQSLERCIATHYKWKIHWKTRTTENFWLRVWRM